MYKILSKQLAFEKNDQKYYYMLVVQENNGIPFSVDLNKDTNFPFINYSLSPKDNGEYYKMEFDYYDRNKNQQQPLWLLHELNVKKLEEMI